MATVSFLSSDTSEPSSSISFTNRLFLSAVESNWYFNPEIWMKLPHCLCQHSSMSLMYFLMSLPVAWILTTALPKGCISTMVFLVNSPATYSLSPRMVPPLTIATSTWCISRIASVKKSPMFVSRLRIAVFCACKGIAKQPAFLPISASPLSSHLTITLCSSSSKGSASVIESNFASTDSTLPWSLSHKVKTHWVFKSLAAFA
mmetsp:Transcript_35641/g.70481  ORF Transcript_35641/g.70481 Transcript_35641/m.70481 type:complete len:203 (-) Transcript_35641:1277-1885(-)